MLGMMMVQRQALDQVQMQVQRLAIDDIGDWGGIWADGSEDSLETLLTTHPQITEGEEEGEEILHYLVSGGWSAELMTGRKREHHDLDVITLKTVPFSFRLDEQKPTSYFETISMTAEEMLEGYYTTVEWTPSKYLKKDGKPKKNAKTFTVYVPVPEYIFMSKITGFMREPREKDYADLEALAQIIGNRSSSLALFDDILRHMPGIDFEIGRNKKLFHDLGADIQEEPSVMAMAAWYVTEIVGEYKDGHSDSARKKAARFHSTLQDIYENGLRNTHSADSLGVSKDLYETAWADKRLEGFWRGENGNIELRIFNNKKNREEEKLLKVWQLTRDFRFPEIESVERYDFQQGKGSMIVAEAERNDEKGKTFLFSEKGDFIGRYIKFVEIDDKVLYGLKREENGECHQDVILHNGKKIGTIDCRPNPERLFQIVHAFVDQMDHEAVLALRKAYCKGSQDREDIDRARRWPYEEFIKQFKIAEAEKAAKDFKLTKDERHASIVTVYNDFIAHYGINPENMRMLRETGILGDEMELAAIPEIQMRIRLHYRRCLEFGKTDEADEFSAYYHFSDEVKMDIVTQTYKEMIGLKNYDKARTIRATGLVRNIEQVHAGLEERLTNRYVELLTEGNIDSAESFADEYAIAEGSRTPFRRSVLHDFVEATDFFNAYQMMGRWPVDDIAGLLSDCMDELDERYEQLLMQETFQEAEKFADDFEMSKDERKGSRGFAYYRYIVNGEFDKADRLIHDNPAMIDPNYEHEEVLENLFDSFNSYVNDHNLLLDEEKIMLQKIAAIRKRGVNDEEGYRKNVQSVYDKSVAKHPNSFFLSYELKDIGEILEISQEEHRSRVATALHNTISGWSQPFFSSYQNAAEGIIDFLLKNKTEIDPEDAYQLYSNSRFKRRNKFFDSLPAEDRATIFAAHPNMFIYKGLTEHDIPLTPETREAGLALFKIYTQNRKIVTPDYLAEILGQKFGITRTELSPIWEGVMMQCLDNENTVSARKHYDNLSASGWVDQASLTAKVKERIGHYESQGEYHTAAFAARDLLGDMDLARRMITKHYEALGRKMDIHSIASFGFDQH